MAKSEHVNKTIINFTTTMQYLKNVEAAAIYHVSEKSIRNWIAAAQEGKLELQLHEHNGRTYLANTTRNQLAIEELVEKGKKYKNGRAVKVVSPSHQFYDVFSPQQIFDIFSNLNIRREIPLQYTYINGNAHHWDDYASRLEQEGIPNILNSSVELLDINKDYINLLTSNFKKISVIDLGVGNALPVKRFLHQLKSQGKLKRYVGIDISEEMLKIANGNIKTWFGDTLDVEMHVKDIARDQFENILAEDSLGLVGNTTINIVLLLGGTLANLRLADHTLRLVSNSIGKDDLLIYTDKLDSQTSRRYFDFHSTPESNNLNPRHKAIIDMLNIDESFYDIEQVYDETLEARMIRIRLKLDILIEFELGSRKKMVELNKGESILLWRAWHQNEFDVIHQFDAQGFDLLQASTTPDKEYLLTISRIKRPQL